MEILKDKAKKSKNTLKEALRQAYDELEKRIEERTADLMQINKRLQEEIIERTKAEDSLHYQIEFEKLIGRMNVASAFRISLAAVLKSGIYLRSFPLYKSVFYDFYRKRFTNPLGSLESIKADVRIITATNKNLENFVMEGNFREDLFYRVNVVRLDLPPLRERMEDVPLLIEHFIARYNEQYGKKINGISEEALMCLLSYDYPGNVRELENIIERTIVLCNFGKIKPNHLPKKLYASFDTKNTFKSNLTQIRKIEAAFLMNMLKQNNWNHQKTSQKLGIHKSTLFRKIKILGLKIPKSNRNRQENPNSYC